MTPDSRRGDERKPTTTAPQISGLVYVQPLGSGGNADVYLYEQQSPRMPVAVKVLKRAAAQSSDAAYERAVAEFLAEADTMAALGDHPYIVQVFRAGLADDGRPYLVMKYYPPPNLAQRSRSERFPVADVLRTGIQLASAVEAAHQARVVHRDIKPANVLISAYGAPGLTDFGIAGRGLRPVSAQSVGREEIGVSVPWAAPEVVFGESNGDARSDVYSLGATLWQLLTGRSPFEVPGGDNSAYALMPRIRNRPVPPTGRADVPVALERLLAQAMAKDPAHRPQSAMELARGLQEVEQQLHLPRTQILVLDDRGRATLLQPGVSVGPATSPDQALAPEHTHVKAPPRIAAQTPAPAPPVAPPPVVPPPPPTQPPAPAPAPPPLRPAPSVGAVAAGSTPDPHAGMPTQPPIARAGTPAHPLPDPVAPVAVGSSQINPAGVDPPSVGSPGAGSPGVDSPRMAWRRSRWAPAVGIASVVIIAAAAWVATGRGSDLPQPAPTTARTIPVTTTDSAIGDGVFVAPTLRAETRPGGVHFTWTYDNPAPRDSYRLQLGASTASVTTGAPLVITTRMHDVPAPTGTSVCALVAVVRAGQISPASAVRCAVAG